MRLPMAVERNYFRGSGAPLSIWLSSGSVQVQCLRSHVLCRCGCVDERRLNARSVWHLRHLPWTAKGGFATTLPSVVTLYAPRVFQVPTHDQIHISLPMSPPASRTPEEVCAFTQGACRTRRTGTGYAASCTYANSLANSISARV